MTCSVDCTVMITIECIHLDGSVQDCNNSIVIMHYIDRRAAWCHVTSVCSSTYLGQFRPLHYLLNVQNWIRYCLKTRGTRTLYLYSLLVDGFPLILPWIQWTKFSGYATHGDGDADLHSIRGRVHIMHPVSCPSTGPACCQHLGRLLARPGPVPEPLLLDPASRMSLLGTLWMLIPSPNNRVCFPWTSQSPSK